MINKKPRFRLFDIFRQGAAPSGEDFAELIQSCINNVDDGLDVPEDSLQPIRVRGHNVAGHLFDFCDQQWQAQWRLSQASVDENRQGLHLTASGHSRLFVDHASGNMGLSCDQPEARLHIRQVGEQDCLRIDDQEVDQSPFIIDSQGKTGIGTLAPTAQLHLDNKGTEDSLRIEGNQDIGLPTDAPFVIKNDGKVGVGFQQPLAKMAIKGGLNVGGSTDPGEGNARVEGDLTVRRDSFLGTNSIDKVVIPGSLQSSLEPNTNSSLVVNDSLQVNNALQVNDSLRVNRDLAVSGNAQLGSATSGSLQVTGSAVIEQGMTVNRDVTIMGQLTVEGDVIARDMQHIDGDVLLGDEDGDTITIQGRLVSGHSSDQLRIDDTVQITENLLVEGVSTFADDVSNTANVTLGSSDEHVITLNGEVRSGHSSGALQLMNPVSVAETLAVAGDAAFAGKTTFFGDTVQGSTSEDTLTVKGSAIVEQNMTVDKDVSIKGHMTVQGNIVSPDTLHINGSVELGSEETDNVLVVGTLKSGRTDSQLLVDDDVLIDGAFSLQNGIAVDTISSSGRLSEDSDSTLATQKAVKGYVDSEIEKSASAMQAIVHEHMPKGAIIMWSGVDIPIGWALCDGTNDTPNLKDRFVLSSGDSHTVGGQGGRANVALSKANLPAHTHEISIQDAGQHSHSINTSDGAENEGTYVQLGNKEASQLNTDEAGLHTHAATIESTGSGTSFSIMPPYYTLALIMKMV